ncbi:hypothetical protein, conserved, partial [Plasmodium ovale]
MSPRGKPHTNFPERVLPSNYFIECLFGDKNFENHINEIEKNKSSNNFQNIISIINKKFQEIFQDITHNFSKDEEVKCCKNINYYFDLLYSIIKSPGELSTSIPNNLISQIETKWNNVPNVIDIGKCKGETDLDSIRT